MLNQYFTLLQELRLISERLRRLQELKQHWFLNQLDLFGHVPGVQPNACHLQPQSGACLQHVRQLKEAGWGGLNEGLGVDGDRGEGGIYLKKTQSPYPSSLSED